jgi:hypothetical protein
MVDFIIDLYFLLDLLQTNIDAFALTGEQMKVVRGV